ncbi:response regulator [Pseudanabaena biceps]|nr:response regulator [Pseudanabaena biceps]
MSQIKRNFIEEAQNYIRELKDKISKLDMGHPRFNQKLDALLAVNGLLKESACKADFYIPHSPFAEINQHFNEAINSFRDRVGDIDWIVKELLIETINMMSQTISEYCLDLAVNPNWMNLQQDVFQQIKEHLEMEDNRFLEIESLGVDEQNYAPFTLNDTSEALHLFDTEGNSKKELQDSKEELQTLFPSILSEPFEGDLDDLLDDMTQISYESENIPLNKPEDSKTLPMPELLVNLFSEMPNERVLGHDDETELQGVNWSGFDRKPEKSLGHDDKIEPQIISWTSLDDDLLNDHNLESREIAEDKKSSDEDIDDVWHKFSSLDDWSDMDENETSILQELEASFDLSDDLDNEDSGLQLQGLFKTLEESDHIFWHSLEDDHDLGVEDFFGMSPSESAELSHIQSPEFSQLDFTSTDVDTALEESPIYQKRRDSLNFVDQDLSSKESLSLNHHQSIRIPFNYLEMLGDLSEQLIVRKGSVSLYLAEMRMLSQVIQQNLKLVDTETTGQNTSAIATLKSNFDKLAATLELTEEQSSVIDQDVIHLRQHLRQSLKHPMSSLVGKLPRILHNLSTQYDKQVELVVQGAELGVERSLTDLITESLEVLLHKAFKHGIESAKERNQQGKSLQAKIEVVALQTDSGLVITLSDDGRGIDRDKIRTQIYQSAAIAGMLPISTINMSDEQLINLIFEPNLHPNDSSENSQTLKLSDIRHKVRAVGGKISVQSLPNQGTQFKICLPNTISLMRVLLIEINQMCLAVSSQSILDILPMDANLNLLDDQRKNLIWGDRVIPIASINTRLKLNCHPQDNPVHRQMANDKPSNAVPAFLIMQHEEQIFVLATDGCWHDQEATLHKVEGDIKLPQIFSGAVILGNNQAVALLNTAEIVDQCLLGQADEAIVIDDQTIEADTETKVSSIGDLNYISDLSDLSNFFGADEQLADSSSDSAAEPIISSSENLESSGLFLTDIAPDASNNQTTTPQANNLRQSKVLIVESSANVRRYLAMTLSKSGFSTEQVQDAKQALAFLKDKLANSIAIDVVITDLEMPQMDGFKLLTDIRADELLHDLPVVVLTSKNNDNDQKLALDLGATAYFSKPYHEQELVNTLHKICTI